MPLRNRVDPCGALHAVPERGAWMGNRGILHDDQGILRRGHAHRAWICCLTDFKGRRRALMQPGRYTELFFLDEATAYAAGHRPCAECRRAAYRGFVGLWQQVHGALPAGPVAPALDRALHAARQNRAGWASEAAGLPPGTMVLAGGQPVLAWGGRFWDWSFAGYAPRAALEGPVQVLTPRPVVDLFAAGLVPQVDASAG